MSDTKFTPGPWKIGKYEMTVVSEAPIPNVSQYSGHTDTQFYGGYLIAESIWRKEDARLIAAAPDLYEALKEAREELRACQAVIHLAGGFDPAYVKGAQAAMKSADAALAKARGENNG